MSRHAAVDRGLVPDDEVRILSLLAVLVRRWRFIAGTMALAIVVGLMVVLLWPRFYSVDAVLVPSSSNETSLGTQMLDAQLPAVLLSGGGVSSDQRMIAAVLKSRSLGDSVVARLGVTPYSGTEEEASIREILARTAIDPNSDGSVRIEARGDDPELTRRLVEAFQPSINGILGGIVAADSRQRQDFLQEQLILAHDRLEESEQRLLAFQRTQDAPEIQEQARRTLEAAAELQQQINEQEILVAQLSRTLTPDHPSLRAAIFERDARIAQLQRLTRGSRIGSEVFLSFGESAELQVEFTRLLRDYTRDEQVYLSLMRALMEAQIGSNGHLPVLSELDSPITPSQPSRIPPTIVLGLAILLGLLIGTTAALAAEYVAVVRKDPGNRALFDAIAQMKRELRREK